MDPDALDHIYGTPPDRAAHDAVYDMVQDWVTSGGDLSVITQAMTQTLNDFNAKSHIEVY